MTSEYCDLAPPYNKPVATDLFLESSFQTFSAFPVWAVHTESVNFKTNILTEVHFVLDRRLARLHVTKQAFTASRKNCLHIYSANEIQDVPKMTPQVYQFLFKRLASETKKLAKFR